MEEIEGKIWFVTMTTFNQVGGEFCNRFSEREIVIIKSPVISVIATVPVSLHKRGYNFFLGR